MAGRHLAVSVVGAAAGAGGKSCRTHSGTGLCIDGTGERNSAGGRAGRRSATDGHDGKADDGFASRRTAGIGSVDAGNGADSLGRGEHLRGGNNLADGWGNHDGFGLVESGDYRECQRCRSRSGGGRERQCSGICDGDERPCI